MRRPGRTADACTYVSVTDVGWDVVTYSRRRRTVRDPRWRSRSCCRRTLRSCYYQYYSTKLNFDIPFSPPKDELPLRTSIFKFNLIYRLKRQPSRHHHFKFLNFAEMCVKGLLCACCLSREYNLELID